MLSQQLLIFLLGAAALHGLYLAALVFFRSKHATEGRLLGVALLAVSLYLFNYLLFLSGLIRQCPECLGVLYPWVFLAGGGFYGFVKKSLLPGYRLNALFLLHLLPFFWGWYRVWPLLKMSVENKKAVIEWFLSPDAVFPFAVILEGNAHIYLLAGYAVAALLVSRRVERSQDMPENRRKAAWMRRFCAVFLGLLCFDLTVKFSFFFLDIPASTVEYVLAATLALAIHLLGYHAVGRLDNFPKIPGVQTSNGKYKTSPLDAGQIENGRLSLQQLMETERPYLDAELKINDLAEALNVPSHHLSQILNEGIGTGFYDFINGYRVRAAQHMLRDARYAHYSVLAVGLDCGFANKTSFNRVFKKMTGMTPTEYARQGRA